MFIETSQANLQNKTKELESKINKLNEQLPTKIDVLTAFNKLHPKKLIFPLKTAGITTKDIDKIINFISKERNKEPFNSLADIMVRSKVNQGKKEVRLITEAKLIKIMDNWSEIFFDQKIYQ